jgi:replicative DNA helicase
MSLDKQIEMTLRDEEFLVGGLLVKPASIYEACEVVTARDFFSDGFGKVFSSIQVLSSMGVPLELANICQELQKVKAVDAIGGPAKFAEMLRTAVPGHVRYYAEEVAKWSRRRKLAVMIDDFANEIRTDVSFDPDRIADEMSLAALVVGDMGSDSQRDCEQIVFAKIEKLEALRKSGKSPVLKTGISAFDSMLMGGMPNGYITIGARPSIGKSALGMEVALRVAQVEKVPTLFVSVEMSLDDCGSRLALRDTSATMQDLNYLSFTDDQLNEMLGTLYAFKGVPCEVWHCPGASIAKIESRIRTDMAKRGTKLVVIDYIQLVKAQKGITDRRLQVSHVSNEIARMSKAYDISIISLAQVGRTAEGQMPTLADLKETGSIEEDSDVVLFLHREDRGSESMTCQVGKFRNGRIAACDLKMLRGKVVGMEERSGNFNDF